MPGEDLSGADDRVLGFTVPTRNARGRLVRLGPVLNNILSAHDYPPVLAKLLAEALVLTAVVGATLRPEEGQMTLQAQARGGAVDLLVCDYMNGELRGYVQIADRAAAEALADDAQLADIFGAGYLAITLDQTASAERYQGVVPLEGDTLCHAVEGYFRDSEQIPTFIRAGVASHGGGYEAGGILLQYLPTSELGAQRLFVQEGHPDWQHVHILAETISGDELTDPALPLETLLWRLFHEDSPSVLPPVRLTRGCRCSADYVTSVLKRFPPDEIEAMRGDDGLIHVDCAFCATRVPVAL